MSSIDQYVKERDEAVMRCWDTNSVEPMSDFLFKNEALYIPGFKKQWEESNELVKWLTISYMTKGIAFMDKKYKDLANDFLNHYNEMKEKDKNGSSN